MRGKKQIRAGAESEAEQQAGLRIAIPPHAPVAVQQ